MTADQYDPAETSTIGSSASASDTSTISHDYQQGVRRSLYGIMRSAGARLEQRVDVFREGRTRQSLFRRSNTACSVGEEDWRVYQEVDPLEMATSKSLGILPWTMHSLLPSSESRQRTAPDIAPGIYGTDLRQAQIPSPSSGTSEDFAEFKSKSWRPPSPTSTLSSTKAVVNFPLTQFPSQSLPQPIRPAQQSEFLPEAVRPTRVTTALKTRKRSTGLRNGEDGVSRNGIAEILMTEKRSGGISSPRRLSSDPIMLYWDDIIEPSNMISWRESLVNMKSNATVADILEALKSLHYPGSGLYLDERGYERPLLSSEVPAVIIRERGEQAGYCMEDSSVLLVGKRLQFLLRFFLKENEDCRSRSNLSPINFEDVNLSANGLFTVPSSLIKNASFIITLDLSRNPLKIIPREFFRFAARLRNLSLSNTGLTLESSSLKYARNLQSLNLSGNRLTNLSDACLHEIPSLAVLNLNDNLLQSLPDHIVYLRSLRILNISYNKFEELPAETALLFALRILDVSFNRITQLPEMLGGLEYLEELVCAGNQITHMPENIIGLRKLRLLDCQWNRIERLGGVFRLPALRRLRADHNSLASLELGDHGHPFQPNVTKTADDMGSSSTSLLRFLSISYNRLTSLPASIGNLTHLEGLECSNNILNDLPPSLGVLKKLRWLDLHNNCIRALPITLWDCESLQMLNLTNNMLDAWLNPWLIWPREFKTEGNSTALRPPLVKILQVLHLGHNRLTATRETTLTSLNGLRVLNLSFNRLRAIPPNFFRRLINLEELHLGGNELPDIGFEQDLLELYSLSKLYLNGNRLRTVPEELRRIKSLRILDLGSNELGAGDKIDWNWDWSSNNDLVYLNLSGNICLSPPVNLPRLSQTGYEASLGLVRSKFSNLFSLSYLVNVRSLGLLGAPNTIISNLDEDKVWVRHSTSIIGGMAYGIADTINPAGENRFLDLFCAIPAHPSCSLIALFGREVSNSDSPNHVPRYLYSHFADVFNEYLAKSNIVEVSLRRTFLQLNQDLFHELQTRTIAGFSQLPS
ncbi:hypothetical protein DL96DRAFT_1558633 [Flagelloscypha sp. PMI_526]|nr:hypothetical protein DL96DRAFT_1558633 [Flagelloscypha sp. PMI_526]